MSRVICLMLTFEAGNMIGSNSNDYFYGETQIQCTNEIHKLIILN